MKVSEVLRRLRSEGWIQVTAKRSHRQFKHPDRPGRVTVSGKLSHTIPLGTLKSVFRQAGWEE